MKEFLTYATRWKFASLWPNVMEFVFDKACLSCNCTCRHCEKQQKTGKLMLFFTLGLCAPLVQLTWWNHPWLSICHSGQTGCYLCEWNCTGMRTEAFFSYRALSPKPVSWIQLPKCETKKPVAELWQPVSVTYPATPDTLRGHVALPSACLLRCPLHWLLETLQGPCVLVHSDLLCSPLEVCCVGPSQCV